MASNPEQRGRRISGASAVDASRYSETIRKLNENRALFRAVFQNVAVGIIYTDSRGTVNGFNPAAEVIIGQPKCEAVGKHFDEVIVPFCKREYEGGLFEHLQSEMVARIEGLPVIEVLQPNGESIPVEFATHETLTREGPIITVIVRDISESIRAAK